MAWLGTRIFGRLALGRAIEQKEAEQQASGSDAWELRFKA